MAEGSMFGDPERVTVWTFEIRGGRPFHVNFTKASGVLSPALGHRWGHTVWKMVGNEAMASEVEIAIQAQGCRVTRWTEEPMGDEVWDALV
jgi:hypothetical protein